MLFRDFHFINFGWWIFGFHFDFCFFSNLIGFNFEGLVMATGVWGQFFLFILHYWCVSVCVFGF